MPKIVRIKSMGKTVYRQNPEFEPGKGIVNACALYGFKKKDLEEVELTKAEYDKDLLAESQPRNDILNAKKDIREKYVGKKKSDITDADAIEYRKLNMALEFKIEL